MAAESAETLSKKRPANLHPFFFLRTPHISAISAVKCFCSAQRLESLVFFAKR